MKYDYDVIVIGSGPAGEGVSMALSKGGKKVAVVERQPRVGGGCTHWGTIPSKALRHAASQVADFNFNPMFRKKVGRVDFRYGELLGLASSVIEKQISMREGFYGRNAVDIIHGTASFTANNTVKVISANGTDSELSARQFIIATGSSPYRPQEVNFDHPRISDSDSILHPEIEPRSIIIYGAGVIGCEYASIFATLGLKVDLVNTRDRLLSFLDDEITDALGYHLRNQGVVLRHNEEMKSISADDFGAYLETQSGKRIRADMVLFANGRSGNTASLNLKSVELQANHRAQLKVNRYFQTEVDHIYAVGDVIGWPGLASASYDQGRFAAAHILGEDVGSLVEHIPTGIYTNPEISSIGKTETDLTEEKVPYEVGRAQFKSIARAQITGWTVGMLKILFHSKTKEILGIHCFGGGASEIIHIGQAIMAQPSPHNSIEYFSHTTFNYPTMAEAYRIAALNGLNRIG